MIKAYGYEEGVELQEDAEGNVKPLVLSEVSLRVTLKELDKIIEFLLYTKDKFEECEITEVGRHEHFQDWMNRFYGWESSNTDIVIGSQKEN